MGARGPMPKRSEARTRRNKTSEDGIALKKGVALEYVPKDADPEWDGAVADLYEGLFQSGMAAYYQQSDADYAWLICDEFAEYRAPGSRKSAVMFAGLINALAGLGVTEGERRRIHIELDPEHTATEEDPKVVSMNQWKDRLAGKQSAAG